MFKVYEWLEEYFAILFFLVICIVMILQVFFRLFLGIAFSWSIELSQYLNVWITFVAIGYVRKLNSHIKIEMFYDWVAKKIPVGFERGLFVLKKVLNIVYMLVVIILGLQLSIRSINFRSSAMQISQFGSIFVCQ